MSSKSKPVREVNPADAGEGRMASEERLEEAPAQLNALLERGEISPEAYAEYATTATHTSDRTTSSHRVRRADPSARRSLLASRHRRGLHR